MSLVKNYKMKEISSDDYIFKRLNYINNKSLNHLNKIEENFNELKDAFYELTRQYEINKSNEEKGKIKQEDINFNPLNEKLNQLIVKEHNNNINFINNVLDKYNSSNCIPSIIEQSNIKKMIDNIEVEMKKLLLDLEEKENNLKMEKTNNIQTINIEMSNKINNIIKKINDISLDLVISNSDKANAIQDIIKIYSNKFKVSKNDFDEFEEKITKLISELLDKVLLLKKG